MKCGRLIKLVKSWYLQVQDEALAPTRMVSFMKQHVEDCIVCMTDPDIQQDLDKISRIIQPLSKTQKLVQSAPKDEEVENAVIDTEEKNGEDEVDDDDDEIEVDDDAVGNI